MSLQPIKSAVICVLTFLIIGQSFAQEDSTHSPIIFIYDASGSMWGQMQDRTKMEIASDVLTNAVNNLPEQQHIGLVAYGHRKKGDCKDVEFLVSPRDGTKSAVTASLKSIKPLGKTPLAFSAMQVIDTLRAQNLKATIILITDGIESCNGNICDLISEAKQEGIDFRLHIIGFGLKDGETEELKCAAEAGDGIYYDAADAGGLSEVLAQATNITIDNPQFNFSGFATKNGLPIDAIFKAISIRDGNSELSARSYKDSAHMFLPPGTYNLEVTPLEGSDVKTITVQNIVSVEGARIHKTVGFDAAKIEVYALNNGEGWDATANVYHHETGKRVAGSRTYGKAKVIELDPGNYDIEFGALIIEGLDRVHRVENVEIAGGETIEVQHNFRSGKVFIGVSDAGGLVDATVNFNEERTGKNVAGSRTYESASSNPKEFILSPGEYSVTIMPVKGDSKGVKKTISISLKEGDTIEKIITY